MLSMRLPKQCRKSPIYRIEKSRNRNTGGSGLGLYIVKQIFESLSITYLMNSTQNGVQFLATIPKGRS